jgi:tRNA/tmRNA/rRNA uracil-C5-methylase (TrmA/RlmC/RlmD family)
MKYGDLINGTITDIDDKGRGVFPAPAPSTGLVVVAFAAIGDTVEAEFYKRDAGVKLAKLKTVVSPAKERIESSCPHAG